MKSSQLFLCFILLCIHANSLFSASAHKPAPVFYIDGNSIQVRVDYYTLLVFRGRGGGLTLASTGNKTCQLDLVQEPQEVDSNLPLTLRPAKSNQGVVHVLSDHNFIFSTATICVQSTVWVLYRDKPTQKSFITMGGVEGYPGRETISNWFMIERYESDYKIVYCHGVCSNCGVKYGDVGVLVEDGNRCLALTNDAPFKVFFKKA